MDVADLAEQQQSALEAFQLAHARQNAQAIPNGHEGICDKCGEYSPRLMRADYFAHYSKDLDIEEGICPRCRDKWRLP